MNKYQWAMLRQKVMGVLLIIGSIWVACYTGGDSLAIPIIATPFGLYYIFTHELVLHTDDLFNEDEGEEF